MICMNLDPSMASTAQQMAQGAAQMMLGIGEHETQVTYSVLKDVIRRMAATPGVRIVVLASPGFITTDTLRTEEIGHHGPRHSQQHHHQHSGYPRSVR
jgi:hypothetical protein